MRWANRMKVPDVAASGGSFLSARVRIDARALATFRIGVALLILADLVLRAREFSFFYTADGAVPQSVAREAAPVAVGSIFHLSSSPSVTAALFVLHGLIAVQLLLGYETKIATVLSFLFVASLDLANPLVLSHADVLFLWLLFWGIFLPLGERWSVDALHADREPRPAVSSVASALILLQMITMYAVNGYQKSRSELWANGEAAVLILGLDDMTFLLGETVRSVPVLLQFGGLTWHYLLVFSWLLLFLRGRARTLFVAMFVAAHASFALTVRIGAFPYVAMAGLLLFLQAQFWDESVALARRLERPRPWLERCRHTVRAIGAAVPRRSDRFGRPRLPFHGSDSSNGALAVGLAVVLLLGTVSLLSMGAVIGDERGPERVTDAADGVTNAANALVSQQTDWNVFAPNPRTTDRYYVFAAETTTGEQLDVYNDRELSYERPHDRLHKQFDTYRERFYMGRLGSTRTPDAAPRLAEHICTEWDENHDDELARITMYRIDETVTRETIDDPSNRERTAVELHRHGCGDHEPGEIDSPSI